MEDNQSSTEQSANQNLTISNAARAFLVETARWTRFLAIMGFIFIGISVLFGIFASSIMSFLSPEDLDGFPGGMTWILGFVYVLMGLLYFFPSWYLLKFSQMIKSALLTNSNDALTKALENQKSFFKFWAILIIIMLLLYVPIFLFGMLFSMF